MTKDQFLKYMLRFGWYYKCLYHKGRFVHLEINNMVFRCELRNNSYRIERHLKVKGWVKFKGGYYSSFEGGLMMPKLRPQHVEQQQVNPALEALYH